MITAIKDGNVEAYKLLFAEATDFLSGYKRVRTFDTSVETYYWKDSNKDFREYDLGNDPSERLNKFANALADGVILYVATGKAPDKFNSKIGITTLEEYFNWLPDLKDSEFGGPTKYVDLPLDEPHFEINANTRAINIPGDFKKNGIAVQGDDLAEVVYFEVDRYFDAMDLNNTTIYIEWETPKDKNHDAVKGVSSPYLRDIESKPGKLIFGWAISDALTGVAGTLKFSVKFFQSVTDETGKTTLAYALNTLTAQVTIQPSIGIDVENDTYVPDDARERLLARIEPGVVVGTVQAEYPRFLEDLNPDIEYDIDDHEDGSLKIYAVATSSDTGEISYVWKRRDLDIKNNKGQNKLDVVLGEDESVTELVPVPTDEKGYPLLKERHAYCYGDHQIDWIGTIEDVKTQWPLTSEKPDPVPTFYERKAVLNVKQYGAYSVEARNRIFNSMSKTNSKEAVFKRPDFINIDNTNESAFGHIINPENPVVLEPPFDDKLPGVLKYQWYRGPESRVASDSYKIMGLPENSLVSYGEKAIRIMIPEETVFEHQNPDTELGANVDYFYVPMYSYIPEGAVKVNNGKYGVLDGEPALISEVPTGQDHKGKYCINYWAVAEYNPTTKSWVRLGESSTTDNYYGWDYVVEWYDEYDGLIKTDNLRVELSNEKCHIELADLEIFEDIVDDVDLAKQKAYIPTEPGYYQVVITRIRNTATISEQSLAYRVTNAPQIP